MTAGANAAPSHRCLNYVVELADAAGDPVARDASNEKFWRKRHETFHATIAMIQAEAKQRGVDLDEPKLRAEVAAQAGAALTYARTVDRWLEEAKMVLAAKIVDLKTQVNLAIGEPKVEAARLADFTDVICWYQHFIHVKLRRAIESQAHERLEAGEIALPRPPGRRGRIPAPPAGATRQNSRARSGVFLRRKPATLSCMAMNTKQVAGRGRPQSTSKRYASDAARWQAVMQRDPRADGTFYYSVATTGVYCRPSCPARRARQENVQFHDSSAAATEAGFRPCRRCRPDEPAWAEHHAALVAAACRTIESADELPTLRQLASAAGLSPFHFHRVFTRLTGLTPKAYAMAQRADRMRRELARRASVTEAVYQAGFNSSGRFYSQSALMLGMKPRHFRAGGAGEVIRFAVGKCFLGAILVAASGKGICAIALGDDPNRLVKELQDRFANAQLIGGDRGFERLVARVVGFIEAPGTEWRLPLDLRGTVFQRRVWQALRRIPPGSTTSYRDLARRIGSPKAVRAVASACAANAIAIAVPCHRVVRTNGALSGYRWGIQRKRALLDQEANAAPSRATGRGEKTRTPTLKS